MKGTRFLDALAEALIIELQTVDAQDEALVSLKELADVFQSDYLIRDRVLHSTAPLAKRLELVENVIKGHMPLPVAHTVLVLLRERALQDLDQFIERFKIVRRRLNQAREIEAISAIPLTDEEKKKIKSVLERQWGLAVSLSTQVDPSMIGGLRLQSGDWQFDATVRGRLDRLAQKLKA
ncbi:MAG TPA: ATP synthase F1 subunit delta [Patescibacteria group bacterium]|nr:ATP synthase F1 subunit delta [Patescibacteria group bacterium]